MFWPLGRVACGVAFMRVVEGACSRARAVVESETMPETDYVEHKSSLAFSETVAQLVQTIERVGMIIFAKIDHAAGAREVGMHLPPSVVLIYGHGRGGTPIIQAAPAAALDLPLRVLVRETGSGQTVIAFHPARQMLAEHPVSKELLDRLAKSQRLLVTAIQDVPGK
jgi:uncharacterized protein (DUF302 family)